MPNILIPRTVIENQRPIEFSLQVTNAMSTSGTDQRVFFESATIYGVSLEKNIIACEGGDESGQSTSATAAAVLSHIYIAPVVETSTVNFSVLIALNPDMKQELEKNIGTVNSGAAAENNKIVLGATNEKQEFKEADEQWGYIFQWDGNDCTFVPITQQGQASLAEDLQYGAALPPGYKFYLLEVQAHKIDEKSYNSTVINVMHDTIQQKGAFVVKVLATS